MIGLWNRLEPKESYTLNKDLLKLIDKALWENVPGDFSLVEFACGYGGLALYLKSRYRNARILGVDIESYDEWIIDPELFTEEDMEQFIIDRPSMQVDVTVMINTYRGFGWEQDWLTNWLKGHSDYLITDLAEKDEKFIPFPFEVMGKFKTSKGSEFELIVCKTREEAPC